MADAFNSEINVGPPPVTLRKRRSFGAIGLVALLLIVGAGAGMVWLNYDKIDDILHTGSASGDRAPVLASAGEGGVSAADFTAFQQQTGSSIQAATDLLAAQQTELKRLSSQIEGLTTQVVGLTSKIDQMQGGRTAIAPAAPAFAAPAPAAVAPAPVVARPAPSVARKRTADRPAGAISVGGAPLPATAAPAPR